MGQAYEAFVFLVNKNDKCGCLLSMVRQKYCLIVDAHYLPCGAGNIL